MSTAPAILNPFPIISTRLFDWDATTHTFSAEDSTLHGRNMRHRGLANYGRVYIDSADVGFTMKSHETGRNAVFALVGTDYSGSGSDREVAGWRFECVTPGLRHIKALIIND